MKLGIVVYKFPAAANTFVVHEVCELVKAGVDVHIWSFGKSGDNEYEMFKDELDLIGRENISICNDRKRKEHLFAWGVFNEHFVPFSENEPRKVLNSFTDQEIVRNEEELAVERSGKCVELISEDVKSKGITHIYAPFAGADAEICMFISKKLDIPLFFSCHAYDLFVKFGYPIEKMKAVTKIFSISNFNKKYLMNEYGYPEDKIRIKRVSYIGETNVKPKSFNHKYIVGAGRLAHMKGFHNSIQAFSEFNKSFPDVHYYILGEGDMRKNLENQIKELNLTDRVHLVGHVSNKEVMSYVKNCEFSILTSVTQKNKDMEGLPTVFVESLSLGKPCIGTNYSGVPEIIKNGKTGYVCEEDDIKSISKKMITLYKEVNNFIKVRSYNKKCKDALKEFDLSKNIKIMIEEFKKC